jgi:hypothetical protein
MTSSPHEMAGARGLPLLAADSPRDALWEHCRNNLGIARLLLHEGRPGPFVATACRMAVESACRAALAQAGLTFDGNAERGFARLAAPRGLGEETRAASPAAHLDAAEAVVAWTARYLRHEAPEHSWGY